MELEELELELKELEELDVPVPPDGEFPICNRATTAAAITPPTTVTISGMKNLFTGTSSRCG
jgi:hypothetical protein